MKFLTNTYKNGSKPTGMTTQAEVDEIKSFANQTLMEKTKDDFERKNLITITSLLRVQDFI